MSTKAVRIGQNVRTAAHFGESTRHKVLVMESDANESDPTKQQPFPLSRESSAGDPPARYELGVVWPNVLGIGSLEDQFDSVRRIEASGFDAYELQMGEAQAIAVTLQKSSTVGEQTANASRSMALSLATAHRPQLLIFATTLRLERRDTNGDHGETDAQPPAWMQRNALCLAETYHDAEGAAQVWPLTDHLRASAPAARVQPHAWHHPDSPWPADACFRIVANESPMTVREECAARGIRCLALGVIRWLPGEQPSLELADFRATNSKAKKLGRMLRWLVKDRAAIRETAQAAQHDLVAADTLAEGICQLAKVR